MRRMIFTLLLIFTFTVAAKAQMRVGAFLGYGEEIDLWGLGARVEFIVKDRIGITPSFFYFFPREINADIRTTMWEWNADAHYYLLYRDRDPVHVYGLAGFNYSTIRTRTEDAISDRTDNEYNAGLNLGVGMLFRINNLLPFVEAKFTAGSYSQFVFFAGVKYQLGNRIEDDYDY